MELETRGSWRFWIVDTGQVNGWDVATILCYRGRRHPMVFETVAKKSSGAFRMRRYLPWENPKVGHDSMVAQLLK